MSKKQLISIKYIVAHLTVWSQRYTASKHVCVLCPRTDPVHFLASCRRKRPNHGLVVALDFSVSVRYGMFFVLLLDFCVHVLFSSLPVRYIDCVHVSSATLNLTNARHTAISHNMILQYNQQQQRFHTK